MFFHVGSLIMVLKDLFYSRSVEKKAPNNSIKTCWSVAKTFTFHEKLSIIVLLLATTDTSKNKYRAKAKIYYYFFHEKCNQLYQTVVTSQQINRTNQRTDSVILC